METFLLRRPEQIRPPWVPALTPGRRQAVPELKVGLELIMHDWAPCQVTYIYFNSSATRLCKSSWDQLGGQTELPKRSPKYTKSCRYFDALSMTQCETLTAA